jgi:predicted RecB family nuclease
MELIIIGIIVSTQERVESHSLWADSLDDEHSIFAALLRIAEKYPEAPIYHYGSYESKGLEHAAKKYGLAVDMVKKRLANVNSFIFGKIYFPTRSNTLKDLGRLLGATWTSSDASGLQSVVWRLQWETSKSDMLKERIIAYNIEDCQALRLLVAELETSIRRQSLDLM